MTIRWFRNKNSSIQSNQRANAKSNERKRGKLRSHLLEMLEPRQLLAVGPQLIGVQPNNSDLLGNGKTLVQSPRELRFRFDDAQIIDASTLNGIRITRSGGDGSFGFATVQSDFGSNGRVNILLTSSEAGKAYGVQVSQSLLALNAAPIVSLSGSTLSIVLNSNANSPTTGDQLVSAINSSVSVAGSITAKINGGLGSARIGLNAVSSYSPLQLNRVHDVVVVPGSISVGQSPDENEVTVRFAESLTDDDYRVEVFGFDDAGLGIVGLRNKSSTGGVGDLFKPTDSRTRQDTINFRLDLGPQVLSVVPQPTNRVNGQLQQQRDTIVVYFDSDKLLVENDANGVPTKRSVENPEFYRLLFTSDTVRNTDDLSFMPTTVVYNAAANTATLRFSGDINELAGSNAGPATYRLRIGTRESAPMQPVRQEAAATVISDLNTNGAVKLRFTARQVGESGSGIKVAFTNSGSAGPTVTATGRVITVNIGGAAVSAQQVLDALRVSPGSASLVSVEFEPGSNPATIVGNRTLSYSPLTLLGLGSSFDTATNIGAIGSAFTSQTSLILSSSIDPEKFTLDLPGSSDDAAHRNLSQNLVGGFEDHVNSSFGADATDGITTIYYNFRSTYALTNAGAALTNAISQDQKTRVREVLSLWAKYIGVQFVETADLGLTFAAGNVTGLQGVAGTQYQNEGNFGVRIDKTFQSSLIVLSATNTWGTEYGASYTRTMAAAVGMALGLEHAGDLPETTLLRLDPTFLAGSGPLTDINDVQLTASDEKYEPIIPGNQDILHAQYLHRPDGSDIDLYRFEVALGDRVGLLTAETYAQRLTNSSTLNTDIKLFRQKQASASTNFGASVPLSLQFEAVRSGAQGNQLQIFFTQTERGDATKPIVLAFPNAISVDLNATSGSESTVQDIIDAIRTSPAASSLVRVSLVRGAASTKVGDNVLTQNPVVLSGGSIELVSQNDDYFSQDSFMSRSLTSGIYYIGVSASGNSDYNGSIAGTGFGGQSQGNYELRINFRSAVDTSDTIQDAVGSSPNGVAVGFDGDADGVPGGTYDFWFQTRPLNRSLNFNAGGSAGLEGRIVTVTGANGSVQVFEFDSNLSISAGRIRIPYTNNSTASQLASVLAAAINARSQLGVVATAVGTNIKLTGERSIVIDPLLNLIDVLGKTIFVDKSAGPNADGSLLRPFNNISSPGVPNAFNATHPGDIVRIVGNGGADGNLATTGDNFAYEIGLGLLPGSVLSDGATMDVPLGVTTMIDAGAVFKLRGARIGIGSSNLNINRSGGALQVLGAPLLLDANGNPQRNSTGSNAEGRVYFTSWLDETIGFDTYSPTTTPAPGNWGGISFRRDVDSSAGRQDLEDQGIFLNYISHADIRYGGGTVTVESVAQSVNPIEFLGSRPTITDNLITRSSSAAMSASPNSFEETNFNEPRFQINGSFTSDYDRVGPEIHRNRLLNNSINGLFIRVDALGLNVPGRFDDIDIVHVLTDNLLINGAIGGPILDGTSPPTALVSLGPNVGGKLLPGIYNYKVTYVDSNGYESAPSNATQSINLQGTQTAISIASLPSASGDFVERKLYRSQGNGSGPFDLVASLDRNTSTFLDIGQLAGGTLSRDRADVSGVTLAEVAGGTLPNGNSFNYRIVMVDAGGREGLSSNPTTDIVLTATGSVQLSNLPRTLAGYVGRRIYRSTNGGTSPYQLVADLPDTLNANTATFTDTGATLAGTLSAESFGVKRPRLGGSLVIDPGAVIKLDSSRIELSFGASLIAEGTDGFPIVFTSKLDDSVGAGGTFDTTNNGTSAGPAPRDWGGIYAAPTSRLSLDYTKLAYAGGVTRLDSTFRAFNTIEVHQADARIAHTLFENNGDGFGGQGPGTRLGRLSNEQATIFVRGAQPAIIDNVFRGNKGSAITIDANSMTDDSLPDPGRQTGDSNRNPNYLANRGPLLRGNRFVNNGLNGLKIRGDNLTTASVWDDTDLVHVVYDEIYTGNVEHEGGLRLQSSPTESLVVKFSGYGSNYNRNLGAGLTANGQLTSATDRVGGTLHLIGQPGFPVILTSLFDDTVGAGLQPDGKPQTDTNNDGIGSIPQAADWRGILLDQYSNDRNVGLVLETEDFAAAAPGPNGLASTAQVLGGLAANLNSGDETHRLGFVVEGTLSQSEDVDVYSFTGVSGAEVWLDIDHTRNNLDLVLELLNANGDLLARSDNSTAEAVDPSLLFVSSLIPRSSVNTLATRSVGTKLTSSGAVKEEGTTNPMDPGMRVRLPGSPGNPGTYFVRIRSSSTNADAAGAGLTSGSYELQVRLREAQEWAGSEINYVDIRYATNAVHLRGLPGESPLIGEAAEDENVRNGSVYANNGVATGNGVTNTSFVGSFFTSVDKQIGNRPQYVGNLLATAKGAISIAGNLSSNRDVDFYALEITQKDIVGSLAGGNASVVFDMDYADGLNRPDTSLNIFQEEPSQFGTQYRLIYSSDSSNIADDQGRPLSITDVEELSRGSAGKGDAYIGPVALPQGNYLVGVSSAAYQPRTKILSPANLKPISSIRRIVDENAIAGVTTADLPVVQNFLPANRTIGATGVLTSAKSFNLGGYSAADLPNLYLDYTLPAGNFEVFVREASGAEFAVASSSDLSLLRLTAGSNAIKIPLGSINTRPVGGGLVTKSFAGQDGLSLVFRGPNGTRIDNVIVGFAERGESVGVANEPILLQQGNIFNPAGLQGTVYPPFLRGAIGSFVTTRPFTLTSYDPFLDRPQVAFDYEVFNGQLDVFVIDADDPTFQVRIATTVNQNLPPRFPLLVTGVPASAVLDISQYGVNFATGADRRLQIEFRARNDDPSRTVIRNVVIQLADGSRVNSGEPNPTYTTVNVPSGVVTTGNYQLEIRLGDEFFQSQRFGSPTLTKSFDTNDRLAEQITLVAPAGSTLTDGDRFTISDGGKTLTFEFTSDANVGLSNVPVPFTATDANFVVARAIRDAVNSAGVQSQLQGNIRAATSSGIESGTAGRDAKINLHGSAYFASVQATNPAGKVQVIFHQGKSDQNARREQSEVIIQNSVFRKSRDYGIWSEAPARLQDPRDAVDLFTRQFMQEKPNFVGTQAVRNLLQPNNAVQGGLVPGIVVQNNLLEEGGLGGIVVQGETPIWMLSPGRIPYAVTGTDPTKYNADYSPFVNSTNPVTHFGYYIDDQDTLVIDSDRTRIRLEFDDLAGGTTALPVAGSGVVEGNGVAADSSVGYYRDTGGSFYQRSQGGGLQPFATNAIETVHALRDSILGSILVTNGTSQVVKATVAESLLGPDPNGADTNFIGVIGYPEYFNRPALYLEGVANLQWQDAPNGLLLNPFDMRQLDLGETPQPQARIVNNTIIGTDGRASFNGGSASVESNDTLATATQTWQGTAHNPLFYSDVGIIGNNSQTTAATSSSAGGTGGAGGNVGLTNFNNNRFLLRFEDGVSAERQAEVLSNQGLVVLKRFDFIKTFLVGMQPVPVEQVVSRLKQIQALPEVKTAEPDFIYQVDRVPNDPQFPQQWHYDNQGQTGGTVDADIDAPEAWDTFTGSSQTVIAVLDTGVDYNHPDLRANMWINPGEIAGDGIDNDGNGFVDDIYGIDTINADSDPMDDQGHGTHVAGTTAAVGNNGIGVTGVSWNSKIMALKVLGTNGGSTAGIIEAIDYMVTMKTKYGINIVVSNNSYGGGGFSQAFQDAIQASINVGIPFVAAAGNSSTDNDLIPHYPSNYPLDGIIAVSATDNNDRLAGFSQFGLTSVDLAAPGVDVLSTTLGGGYGLNSGTSMASPHVAGAVALIAGAVPGSSVAKLKAAILLGADPIPSLQGKSVTGARLNLAKSLFVLKAGLDTSITNTDVDIYQFKLGVGERAIVDVDSANSGLDSVLQIFDSHGVPQFFVNASGVRMSASDNDAAPGEAPSLDSYADFTATSPGVYYAAVSSVGNTSYDPISSANRQPAKTTGAYRITISARHLQDFVITAQDASAYSEGDTFTIFGVPDIDGTGSSGRTFEFTFSGQSRAGNIPIQLGTGWRFPDVAQAITRAINEGLNKGPAVSNYQLLPNGNFGLTSPLPAVHARALGGIGGIIDAPFNGLKGDKDIILNQLKTVGTEGKNKVSNLAIQQQIRGPFTEVNQGLELFPRRFDGDIFTNSGFGGLANISTLSNLGIGHDRQSTFPISFTTRGDGTTEKFVLVHNAAWIDGNNQIIVDPDVNESNNLDQLLPETGVLATRGASPTILNNVFFNLQTPVVNQESRVNQNTGVAEPYGSNNPNIVSKPGDVVLAGSVYQYYEKGIASARFGTGIETSPTNIPNTALDQNIDVGNGVRLFVNPQAGQYLPSPGSLLIDSSINSLSERQSLAAVRNAMGLANSAIVAPDFDLVGLLRVDDPTVAPPGGLGQNVFKDRGAFERADFIGPSAILSNPIDNDALGVDQDGSVSVVQLTGGVYPEFRIQLKDGNEPTNPLRGIGIDDDSVTNSVLPNLRVTGASIALFENGRLLTEGIDYRFAYNATRDEIILTPLAGVWKNGKVYEITLNNKNRFVISAPSGEQITDGDAFTITDADGGIVNFEFDSGYRLQLPQGLTLEVPLAGAGAGGVVDGDRFTINDGTTSVTFELDRNSLVLSGNVPVVFAANSTQQSIAQSIKNAIAASGLSVSPQLFPAGVVYLGSKAGTKVSTTFSRLSQAKSTLGLQVPSLGAISDGQTFSLSDGLATIVFEFDNNATVARGNRRIDITNAASITDLAKLIQAAIIASPLQLSPVLIGTDTVHLGLSPSGDVLILNSNLGIVGVSRSVADGQSFSISLGSTTKTFEFDSNGSVAAGSIAIPFSLTDTQDTLGVRTASIIQAAGLGLTPVHVRDGNISIGGTELHTIAVQNAPSIGLFGKPGVASTTTLEITGSLVLQVPGRGGIDIQDNKTFSITANNRTVVFEFDRNFSGPSAVGNVVISFTVANTANEIVASMVAAINGAGLNVNSRAIGSGLIDLGLLADNQVNVGDSGLTSQRGNVADGEFFTIGSGTKTATFEFVNVSLAGGAAAGRIPILFSNASTRADVITAMKAAIEGAGLGLSSTVIGPSTLRLLDTPRFLYDFSAAPSLKRTGVPGGATAIQFTQDVSYTSTLVAQSIVRAVNAAPNTPLSAKIRGANTIFVENATSISPDIPNFFLRAIEDLAGNDLKPNRVNNETEFTILMPGVALDFGDAPDPVTTTPGRYPTLFAFDGARHVADANGLKLGATVSSELDGLPTSRADGDTGDDGVSFQFQALAKPIFNRNVDTTVTVTLSAPGIVDGWIDFNGDGDWTDPGENVLNGAEFTLATLTRQFQIRVPATAPIPATGVNSFARFRASTAGQSLPTGLALDGEVEDYLVRIVPGVPPVGVVDNYTMSEDQVGGLVTTDPTGNVTPSFKVDDGVLANDLSPDGRPLFARLVTNPQHVRGSFEFHTDGTFNYQPTPDYFGLDTFVYASYVNLDVNEGELLESLELTTVTINIRPVNDRPTANNFDSSVSEDTQLTLSEQNIIIFSGATPGPANESGQTLRVSLPNFVSAQGGSLNLIGSNLVYTPKLDFSGVDTFTFTLTDNGITGTLPDPLSVTRTVTVTVRDANDAPTTTPKSFTVVEDIVDSRNTFPVSFFTNGDSAGPPSETLPPPVGQGQTLSFSGVIPQTEKGGTVSFANGLVTYRSAADFNGEDRFFYLVTDSDPTNPLTSRGTVTVTVTAVDDTPRVVTPLGTINMQEDEAERALPLASYFFDPDVVPNDDRLTYRVVSNSNPSLVEPTIGPNDIFVRPKPDQNGQAVIVFEASDRAGNKVQNTLTVIVAPVSDPPRLVSPLPNLSVAEDAIIPETVLSPTYFFDPDIGDTLVFSVTNSNSDVVTASIVNGRLRLVLVPDASGVATITVKVVDSTGNVLEDSFDISVAPVNDAPRVVNDLFYTTPQGSELRTTDATGTLTTTLLDNGVLANDRDIEGNTFTARIKVAPTLGTVTLNADGTFSYIPFATTLKGAVDSFQYEAVDSLGAVSAPGRASITIGNPLPSKHQNPIQRLDVDADGFVSPIDVLLIINFINFNGPSVSVIGLPAPPPYRDVNGNNVIEPLDVLEIINFINDRGNSGAGEGEMVGVSNAMPNLAAPLTWSSDVMRESQNLATAMGAVPIINHGGDHRATLAANAVQPLGQNSGPVPASLADYLGNFGMDDEELEKLALSTSDSIAADDHESLDSFFADVFGS